MKNAITSFVPLLNDLNNKEVVYLFGSGISSGIAKKNLGWKSWIESGIKGIKNSELSKSLLSLLSSSNSADELIELISKVIEARKTEDTYNVWMDGFLCHNDPVNVELIKSLKKLSITNDTFVTTNYDLLLETATGLKTLHYGETAKTFRMLENKRNDAVIHFHGVYDTISGVDNIVASREQYEALLNDKGAQFIQNVIGTKTIIFIGCGKTGDDMNISSFIDFSSKYLRMNHNYYYLINSKEEIGCLPGNIIPISYGDDYDDLASFLNDLAIYRIKSKVTKDNLVAFTNFDNYNHTNASLLRYHFAQRCIPFCGRKSEMNRLDSFVNSEEKEQWWAITGQAGSGKSRLALELINHLPPSWLGFFLNSKALQNDINSFTPFCDSLIVIDYVSGRETEIFDCMILFINKFKKTDYKLRICLIERENSKATGSWYSKLLNRGLTSENEFLKSFEYCAEFLYLGDLESDAIKEFIHHVCILNDYVSNDKEETLLLKEYASKFERLQFRPLYVQLFVEAWINNGFLLPTYDDYSSLIEELLKREEGKWLTSLDGDSLTCNAFIRLLVRANIKPIPFDEIPELYKKDWDKIEAFVKNHSFPGKQKYEFKNILIRSLCQNIDNNNEIVAPQFPDLIKEYMFSYYTDKEFVGEMMKEIWENASNDYSIFIKRCLMDFHQIPFYKESLSVYSEITSNVEALKGRLDLLDDNKLKRGDNPFVYLSLINNEYYFWLSLPVADNVDNKELLLFLKLTGLYRVVSNICGWVTNDVSPVLRVIKDINDVKCDDNTNTLKKFYLSNIATNLAESSFIDESNYVLGLLEKDGGGDEFDSYISLASVNDLIMNNIFQHNGEEALKVFNKTMNSIDMHNIELCQIGASLCYRFLEASRDVGLVYEAAVLDKIYEFSLIYPDDILITFRKITCEMIKIEYQIASNVIDKEKIIDYLVSIEEKTILKNGYTGDVLESYGDMLAHYGFFWLNYGSKEKVCDLIEKCNNVLNKNNKMSIVVYLLVNSYLCLYREHIKEIIPGDIVNSLYKFVEINSDSETVIVSFFALLEESEKKDHRDDYLSDKIIATLYHDIYYNPKNIHASGTYRRMNVKIGANEPCPCGSGKKFKKCCRDKGIYD